MNKKISVFILLILLASSFKYRAKSVESSTPKQNGLPIASLGENSSKRDAFKFEDFEAELHKANQELVSGNPEPFKSLWLEGNEMNTLGLAAPEIKAVAVTYNGTAQVSATKGEYSYENISTEVGSDLAYLVQTEHYRKPGEKPVDMEVTLVCRKNDTGWKIVHRRATPIQIK